jgi:hypothetical protein
MSEPLLLLLWANSDTQGLRPNLFGLWLTKVKGFKLTQNGLWKTSVMKQSLR